MNVDAVGPPNPASPQVAFTVKVMRLLWVAAALLMALMSLEAEPALAIQSSDTTSTLEVIWVENTGIKLPEDDSVEPAATLVVSSDLETTFDMIGLLWDEGQVTKLWLQSRDPTGVWGEWIEVPVAADHDNDAGDGRPGSSPVYTGRSTAARFAAIGNFTGAEAMMIDTKALTPAVGFTEPIAPTESPESAVGVVSPPDPWWNGASFVRDRSEWDTTGCRRPDAEYNFSTPQAIVVHHTASSNSYSEAEVPGVITGHCIFHVNGRGWDDLGYNFMVDRFGNVWEGRTASKTAAIQGAHTAGFNSKTQGVAMMGNFETSAPSSSHLSGLRGILNWLTGWHSVDPTGQVTLIAGSTNNGGWEGGEPITVPSIIGHRDLGSTNCPGSVFYGTFAALRASIDPVDFGIDPSAIRCDGLVPTFLGTLGHDQMRGTDGPDVIHGLAGNDLIYGLDGDDIVCGGLGNDYLIPGVGFDEVLGEDGSDTCGGDNIESCEVITNEEMFFYRDDGLFRYYDIRVDASLPSPLLAGSGYAGGWTSISAVDLDGDGQDEMFFYRDDGLYSYDNVNPDGTLGSPIRSGTGYTAGWSSITAVDLDGDGQDEMFFYRDDGLFRFYDIDGGADVGLPILAGTGYTAGWSSIAAIDLEGDGQDEMVFYRGDGLFRYYDVNPDGTLPSPLRAGTGYTSDWTAVTSIDLDGDAQGEMFFYRDDGLYRYYQIDETADLGSPILAGVAYTTGWSSIAAVDLDHHDY